tara:strand:+ start:502 stop:774 length:273 start_codon:yes stop_codon:yes gene_type:complete
MDDEEDIKLTENEGAIILREDLIPEIYAPIGFGENCDNVRFTLAFLLYAVEREDWVEEFSGFVDSVKDTYAVSEEVEKRAKFEVIDGGKD